MLKKFDSKINFWIIACAALGGILYGYDIGVISGALLCIKKSIPMDDSQLGMIVGAVLGGGLIGNLFTGSLADNYGRRTMIIIACFIFIVGIAIILFANSYYPLLIARLILGLGVGVVSVAIPLYISEIAPTQIRGRGITAFQLFLTFGILFAYIIDSIFIPSNSWHAMFAVILIPSITLLIGMWFLPETPRWLLAKDRNELALQILQKIRPADKVASEIQEIKESFDEDKGSWFDLLSRKLALPLFIGLFIAIANQLTGINVIFQYAPMILQQAGFNSHSTLMLGTIGLGAINFVTTIISISLIDFLGRKQLLIFGTTGIVISACFLAFLPHLDLPAQTQAIYSLAGLLIYVFSFAIGPGVVVWLAISELLPTKVRGKAIALCLFANSLASTIFSGIFLHLIDWIGMHGIYLIFAISTFAYFLVATFLLPETKSKSLESIQAYFNDKHKQGKLSTDND